MPVGWQAQVLFGFFVGLGLGLANACWALAAMLIGRGQAKT